MVGGTGILRKKKKYKEKTCIILFEAMCPGELCTIRPEMCIKEVNQVKFYVMLIIREAAESHGQCRYCLEKHDERLL